MPARPLYLGTDVLQRARDLEFRQRADRDIWKLGFDQQAESDITGLSKLIEPPQLELQAAPEQEPLPIVVSDRPDALALQRQAQERQMPQQPMMQPQQQAPAASGAPVAMPTASQAGQTAQRRVGTPNGGVEQWSDLVDEASRAYGVPQAIIKGIMDIESGGRADAVSAAGAMGLMQVMPFHYDEGEDGMDPRTSVLRGAKILADNYRRWGTWDQAAAAYFGAIDAQGNITGATDATGTDGTNYVRLFRDAAGRYGGVPDAAPAMPRLSLNAVPAAAPGRTAPPAPAGVASTPAGAPPAPWETAGASDGAAPLMLKENDETAPMGGGDAMLPGDGGFAPTPEYDPRAVDEGPRESRPAQIPPTDPTVSDPAYTQSPTGMSYGPIQQGEVQGPQAPPPNQIDRYVPSYAAQAAQVAPTMPTPAAGAVQASIDAAVESYNDPFYQAGPQPPRWVKIVSDAMQAFGTESAKNVARSLGVTDEEWFSVFGFPISRVDVAGFAGGIAADPTNYVGLNMADPLVTVARGAVRDFAPEAVKNVGRAVGSTLREGAESLGRGLQGVGREVAGGLMDLNPAMTPRVIGDGGPGIGRAMTDGAGEAATIGRGGAPVEPPRVWTTRSTADTFDLEWAPEGFLEQAGIPIAAPRRPKPDDDLFHLTSRDNLERVAREGLTPTAGDERATDILLPDGSRTVRRPAVYAADNAPILSTVDRDMAGTVEWSVLRFKRGNRGWRKDPEFATDPGSWVTRRSIPAAEIEVLTSDGWRPVTEVARTAVEPPGVLSTVASPGPRGAGIGTRLATDAGNALAGSMVGAVAPADSPEERLRNTALGAAGFPIAGRLIRNRGGSLSSLVGPNRAAEAPREPAPVFYSQLRRTLDEKMPNRANGQQIMGILRGSPVKPDEIAWTGLDDWLRQQRGPVTKQQVLDFLDQNAVQIEEVVKGQPLIRWRAEGDALVAAEAPTLRVVQEADGSYRVQHDGRVSPVPFATVDEAKQAAQDIATDPRVGLLPKPDQTRYGQYTLPGGENYRELLLTLPQQGQRRFRYYDPSGRPGGLVDSEEQAQEVVRMAGGRYAPEHVADPNNPAYRSSHWDEPNVLAHVRFNERTAPDGRRVLLIEEIQSDWHQAGRRQGYKAPRPTADELARREALTARRGSLTADEQQELNALINRELGIAPHGTVPDAPFKKTWPELAIKRMVRWAAENGFDQIAWPPGAVHAERFSLAQSVDDLRYITKDGSTGTLVAYKGGEEIATHQNVPADKLGDYVGQDVARRLFDREPDIRAYGDEYRLTGRDLTSVGGEGMKGFYDKIVPDAASKIGKKFGARVGTSEVALEQRYRVTNAQGRVVAPEADLTPDEIADWRSKGLTVEPAGRTQPVHSMDITPQMRESVVYQGQPQFAALPFDPASAAAGGAAGAMSEGEDGEQGDPLRTAGAMAVAGILGNVSPRAAARWRQATQRAAMQAAAARAAGKAPPPTAGDWLRSIGYSGMIGPSTGIVNAVGNGMELLYHLPKDFARSVARGNPAEAWAEAKGMTAGLMRAGGEMLDALAGAHPGGGVENARLSQRVQNPIGQVLANLIEAPTRVFSEVPDAFYRSIATSMGESRRAAQIATDEGLKGAAWSQRVNQLLADVAAHRNGGAASPQVVDIIKDGVQVAERLTLRGDVGPAGKHFKGWIDTLPFGIGNILVPFFNTPYQMLQRAGERSPAGLRMGTQPAKFDKYYDAIVGSGIGLGVLGLATGGMVTGSGPSDPEKRRMLQSQGWQGNSTLVGGVWVPNNAFGVFGPLLDTAGEIGDGLRYQKEDAKDRDLGANLLSRASKIVQNQVYLRGFADIIRATQEQGAGPESFAANLASRLIPGGATARMIGNMTDEQERAVDRPQDVGSIEAVRQRVARGLPGQGLPVVGGREQLPPAQDVLGRPVENERSGAAAFGPKTRTPKADPVVQMFLDAGVDIGNPKDEIAVGGSRAPVELSPNEKRRWQALRGEFVAQHSTAFLENPTFMALEPVQKERYLKTFLTQAGDYADKMLQAEMDVDDLTRRATEGALKKRAS